MTILDKIIATKYEEIEALRATRSFKEIHREAKAVKRRAISFSNALATSRSGIIAEFKRRSPSKGFINEHARVADIVPGYEQAGAAAISVLTDKPYFGGSLDDLRQARKLVNIPLLRKDFIVHPYQLCEARIAGADVILLIASALTPDEVAELASFAHSLGLEVLLEIHNEEELGHISDDVDVVGVNNRDLSTFVTDIAVSKRLAGLIPSGRIRISESGISGVSAIRELQKAGYRGFLIGENFMRTEDPASSLATFINEI